MGIITIALGAISTMALLDTLCVATSGIVATLRG
jgi:hypothetical protein